MMKALTFALILIAVSGASHAWAPLKAVAVDSPPVIDGDLSDACWQSAPKTSDFFHLETGAAATEPTTAWIAYDEKNIYAAFDCKDSRPELIRALQQKRGGEMEEDDSVCLVIDPFTEQRWVALNEFRVNAIGTQRHSVQSSESGKTEWIGDWEAAVKRNPDGYSVEIRIPFSILKYDSQNPNISVAFERKQARLSTEFFAPNIGKNQDLSKIYHWDGVRPPAYRPKPIIMGYYLVGTGSGDTPNRLGLDIKHALTPGMSGLLTLNPDFRNVEKEVDIVDFTYTERQLDDTRPFFREGMQYFPGSRVCYTRRIGEIDAGAKVVGMAGPMKIALLNATTFGHESFTAGQVGRQFGPNGDHWVWLGGALSDVETGSYLTSFTTVGGKWRRTEKRNICFNYDYLNTGSSADPKHGALERYSVWTENGARRLEWFVRRNICDDDFEPYLGIETDVGLREWETWLGLYDAPEKGRISRWDIGVESYFADHLDGSPFYDYVQPYASVEYRNGQSIDFGYVFNDREGNRDRFVTAEYGWSLKDLYRAGSFELNLGRQAGGSYRYLGFTKGFRLTHRLSTQLRFGYSHIGEPSVAAGTDRQTIVSTNYDISPEKGFGGRIISQYGKSNVYFFYCQRVRAGMDAFLIYGHPNPDETGNTVLLKLVTPL